ncbi:hypothetical protein [Candidatus Cyanaurora vandensis]|uniref:hypothetical protein n=1 Tax=Candidatus Cyanaurora vandensis TaxID=2714958 RepID=UPI00257BF2B0|nr:hypothetical protein [Candidatus Cyanaurora vandensis]
MKKAIDQFVDAFLNLFQARSFSFPRIGPQPFQDTSCRTSGGRACTLGNLDRRR